ncbi:MAG TPA: hypothetical protein VK700_02540 [Steroidobacteraceae bacterium]|nr:hypothetical protein [Steroidobacteraceae bacterium]
MSQEEFDVNGVTPNGSSVDDHPVTPREKALKVNLDPSSYGSFAEIGAGQEVVRWFFRAGGAAGTISKSISAYDMKVSDAIYGPCARYVCRERLQSMLDYEQRLNIERLMDGRGKTTAFFTFADTVSARSFRGNNECHGWLGIKFQPRPLSDSSQIIIHVRMLDVENSLQQEALGIVGLNLIYGSQYFSQDPDRLVESLLDGLSTDRIEIDLIEFSGPEFSRVDNRVMSLRLVQLHLTGAAMFSCDGKVLQPSEVLHKKPVLVERGRFRPVTYVNLDLARSALKAFEAEGDDVRPGETISIMEITMSSLTNDGTVDLQDFISRAEVLAATGHTVMISDFAEYYRLAAYLFRYTSRRVGLAMGAMNLEAIFDESYYSRLDGGILESFGRLFRNNLRLYIYPYMDQKSGKLVTVNDVDVGESLRQLYGYLLSRRCIVQLQDANHTYLSIYSPDVLRKINSGNTEWESMVPPEVAHAIKTRGLFGYQ